jgi:hypothetical protein
MKTHKLLKNNGCIFKFYYSKGEIKNAKQPIKTAFEILKSFSLDDFIQYFLEIQVLEMLNDKFKLLKKKEEKKRLLA